MDIYTIIPRSPASAECDPVILRETATTRLVFKPTLVNNAHDHGAPLNGSFVFQRKSVGHWEDYNEVPLARLRANEWVKLDLKAGEVHTLLQHMAGLYRVYRRHGLPRKKIHFFKIDLAASDAEEIARLDVRRLFELSRRTGVDVFSQLIEWAVQLGNAAEVLECLEHLNIRSHFKTWSLRYHHAMHCEGNQRRRAMAWRGLTEQQWEAIRVHLPEPKPSPLGGRPRVEARRCFEGILWILWTGAQWSELPRWYGRASTCWRQLKQWEESGVLLQL
jgi:hypothetical protein